MSSGQFDTGFPPGESYERLGAGEISGADVTKIDRFFAPVEAPTPLEEADLQRHASKILPGVARTMRGLTRGRSEARIHALPHTLERDPEQAKTRMRQDRRRLRQSSHALFTGRELANDDRLLDVLGW
jgi:hypothetical protein